MNRYLDDISKLGQPSKPQREALVKYQPALAAQKAMDLHPAITVTNNQAKIQKSQLGTFVKESAKVRGLDRPEKSLPAFAA